MTKFNRDWFIFWIALPLLRTGHLSSSLSIRAVAPFRGDPLRLGIVHGITWIFVDHIVEFEDLRLLGRKTVDDRDTILIVRAHVIERGVLVVRVNDQGGFGRAARRQIGARANFFGSHVAVTVPVGQGQIRSVWAHSRRDAHYRPFSKGTFSARHWTHLPWTEPPSNFKEVYISIFMYRYFLFFFLNNKFKIRSNFEFFFTRTFLQEF